MVKKKISMAIPASVTSDTPHLREKTAKIGLIGRAAAIFRVDEIIVYLDNLHVKQEADMNLVATLLAYMETPQYLRKRLFKLKPQLRYAGVLPPLRTPHHPLNRKIRDLKVGEYREGVTISSDESGTRVDIGVEKPALIPNKRLAKGQRITVKVTRVDEQVEVTLASREEIPQYWGYKVTMERQTLGKLLRSRAFDLTIATSKYGVPLSDVAEEICKKREKAENILMIFGAPTQGLYEIARLEGLALDDIVDFVVNTVPMQGTETVRTEEAVMATLAIFNMEFASKV
ncbi:MAG: putative RNA uridine N3 methyltransferase [Candidatus Bathyarchaeia archaeon]|nr:MAG: RNA-binding protein [Candidatus Bathyarchaeota archaeon]